LKRAEEAREVEARVEAIGVEVGASMKSSPPSELGDNFVRYRSPRPSRPGGLSAPLVTRSRFG